MNIFELLTTFWGFVFGAAIGALIGFKVAKDKVMNMIDTFKEDLNEKIFGSFTPDQYTEVNVETGKTRTP